MPIATDRSDVRSSRVSSRRYLVAGSELILRRFPPHDRFDPRKRTSPDGLDMSQGGNNRKSRQQAILASGLRPHRANSRGIASRSRHRRRQRGSPDLGSPACPARRALSTIGKSARISARSTDRSLPPPPQQTYCQPYEKDDNHERGERRHQRQKRNQKRATEFGGCDDRVAETAGQDGRVRPERRGRNLRESGNAAPRNDGRRPFH